MRRSLVLGLVLAGVLLAATPAQAVTLFQSPSRNIGCVMADGIVRCDIREKSWRAPPKPASCELDWGFGLTVDRRGRAQFVCAGDTALGQGRLLAYGTSIRRGRFRCTSRVTGMRCVNLVTRHGFFISRARARRF